MPANPVASVLDSISLGPSIVINNLTMIPLILKAGKSGTTHREARTPILDPRTSILEPRSSRLDYAVLDDALASGAVEITEVSEQGSVPDLKFLNRGSRPVLIVDGEELVGARQNRIVNLSILVAAHSELTIPVSCVEAGRWRARSRSFTSAPRTQYATGRAKRMANVSFSLAARGDRMSDQAEVWQDIAEKSSRLDADSPTSAMEAIFDRHVGSIDEYVAGCRPVDDQVGAMFFVGDALIGFDLFDRPSTLAKLLPKLVRGVAVDAIDVGAARSESGLPPTRDSRGFRPSPAEQRHRQTDGPESDAALRLRAEQFLAVTAAAPQHLTPALGLGQDARLTASHIAGAALVNEYHVVHLSSFVL
jgi:hypothetical protein